MHLLTQFTAPMTTTDGSTLLLLPDASLPPLPPNGCGPRSVWQQRYLRSVNQKATSIVNFISEPKLKEDVISFETPVLTNVVTKKGMAIIKVDHEAIMMLRQLSRQNNQPWNNKSSMQCKHASTEPFSLTLGQPDEVINVTFKLYVDGCSSAPKDAGKYVSIFLEISPNDPNMTLRPLVVTLFLKNLKDADNGKSYKRCFKILDAPGGFPVERGLKEFLNMADFEKCLENEKNGGTLAFGVMVQTL